jgi:hypothetical protein
MITCGFVFSEALLAVAVLLAVFFPRATIALAVVLTLLGIWDAATLNAHPELFSAVCG